MTEHDLLNQFHRDIGNQKLLSFDEEIELAYRIQQGKETLQFLESKEKILPEFELNWLMYVWSGERAREELIMKNLPFANWVAQKMHKPKLQPFIDTIHDGILGLLKAVDKYKPFESEKRVRFSTYAHWWIRQRIQRSFIDDGRTIRLPYHILVLLRMHNEAQIKLIAKLYREPTVREMARYLHWTIQKVREIEDLTKGIFSIDAMFNDEDNPTKNSLTSKPITTVDDNDRRKSIEVHLSKLGQRERLIIELRFGLKDEEPKSLEEIGKLLRISKERIRQIQDRTLRKLSQYPALQSYLYQ